MAPPPDDTCEHWLWLACITQSRAADGVGWASERAGRGVAERSGGQSRPAPMARELGESAPHNNTHAQHTQAAAVGSLSGRPQCGRPAWLGLAFGSDLIWAERRPACVWPAHWAGAVGLGCWLFVLVIVFALIVAGRRRRRALASAAAARGSLAEGGALRSRPLGANTQRTQNSAHLLADLAQATAT